MKVVLLALAISFLGSTALARNITLRNPSVDGVPILALTNADSAILMGNPDHNGTPRSVNRSLQNRAQSICTYHRLGQLVDYRRGYPGGHEYVEIRGNRYAERVPYAYLRPFETPYGVGLPEGFSSVVCRSR